MAIEESKVPENITPYIRKYACFKDTAGNVLVFPGLYSCDADFEFRTMSYTDKMTLSQLLRLRIEPDHEVVVDKTGTPQMKCILTSAGHPNFMHGSEDVLLIAGPIFDEEFSKSETEKTD